MGSILYGKDLVPHDFLCGGGFARRLRNDDQPHHDFNNCGALYDREREINGRSKHCLNDQHTEGYEHFENDNADDSGGEGVFKHLETIRRASDRHSLLVHFRAERTVAERFPASRPHGCSATVLSLGAAFFVRAFVAPDLYSAKPLRTAERLHKLSEWGTA